MAWATFALASWQMLPDRYIGPYNAWNPHAIMEFVITIYSISIIGKLVIHFFGAYYGLLLTGLTAGFASSTATIHAMGKVAKANPTMADRAALGGVLSNLATLLQLLVLLQLLSPQLLMRLMQPICFGLVAMGGYTLWVLYFSEAPSREAVERHTSQPVDWKSLLVLIAMVCGVSLVSAALNATYGQEGLWLGAAFSGLVDAHAIIPTVASLLTQDKLQASDAVIPLLIAFSVNSMTKSLIAFQAGGWVFARKISGGVWLTTAAVWGGYIAQRSGFGFY